MTRHNRNHLDLRHTKGEVYRLLPRHGEPVWVVEWLSQRAIKCLALFPIYFILIILLTLFVQFWLVPLL
jgi:hypothetical protein